MLGSLWAGADESCTPQIWESAGLIRPAGPLPISTTFPSPTTRYEESQLATAERSYGPQTAADRGRHQRPLQQPVRVPLLRRPRVRLQERLQSHDRVQHPRLARDLKLCPRLAHRDFSQGGDQCSGAVLNQVHTVLLNCLVSASHLASNRSVTFLLQRFMGFAAVASRFCLPWSQVPAQYHPHRTAELHLRFEAKFSVQTHRRGRTL